MIKYISVKICVICGKYKHYSFSIMIKTSLKQAWAMMKQNRLFTSIYVAGTALSVAFTMILFIIYYVKFAPIYPEYNRNRTLVINNLRTETNGGNNWSCNAGVSSKMIGLLKDLKHLDKMGAASQMGGFLGLSLTLPESNETYTPIIQLVDHGFWEVFTFNFISGKPFTEVDVESNLPKAVISESMANRYFATSDATGKYLDFDGNKIQVCGVVKDGSTASMTTMGEVYLPLYFSGLLVQHKDDVSLSGSIALYLTAPSSGEMEMLRAEVQEVVKQYDLQYEDMVNNLIGQPDVWWKNYFREVCSMEPDIAASVRGILYMVLALLFIPAMNLCGMISSRMDERLSELGVRKAYGATNRSLIGQVLTENLLLTIVGALIGLALAYFIVLAGSEWVMKIMDAGNALSGMKVTYPMTFHLEMLINLPLFLTVLGLCLILNLVSALVPTVLALRHPIIYSIHSKR